MNEEQISKLETLHNKIYKETEEYGRTQFVSRIVDLEHNWNELKKCLEDYLKEKSKERLYDNNSYEAGVIATYENVFDKMQELEEGGNNDN